MSPHRIIHDHKGYLTETVYDADLQRFVERAWPPAAQNPPTTVSPIQQNPADGLVSVRDAQVACQIRAAE